MDKTMAARSFGFVLAVSVLSMPSLGLAQQVVKRPTVFVAEQGRGPSKTARIAAVAGGGLIGLALVDSKRNRVDLDQSIRGIRRELGALSELQLVKSDADADVVVTVVNRGAGPDSFAGRLEANAQQYAGVDLAKESVPAGTYWLSVVVEHSSARRELLQTITFEQPDYRGPIWTTLESGTVNEIRTLLGMPVGARPASAVESPVSSRGSEATSRPLAVSTVVPATVPAQQNTPLSNQDVVTLTRAGLSDDVIILKIGASQVAFDTSVDALVALKTAGVSDRVIAAMIKLRH